MDRDANARHQHAIDWLELAPDLPHLIARVSELVLRLGYAPDELVILPRGELDRRELSAYSAGWADVVDERLPAIRRAYEERITAAYLQGQEDARTGRRPRRARRPEGERGGGEVIPLPYVQLLRPPSEVTRVERRGERERSVADGTPVRGSGAGGAPGASRDASAAPYGREEGVREGGGRRAADALPSVPPPPSGTEAAADAGDESGDPSGWPATGSAADILLSAREIREKRSAPSDRRPVVRRNGRPSVPPLDRPGETGAGRDRGRRAEPEERQEDPAESSAARGAGRPRLSDRARALADELEGRAAGRRSDEQPGPSDSR
ncbi:hypothetical protein ACFSL4_11885 [Streptomyces caeni]|uniref:Uncharacterized protein n=1 Tax=Streptomyces caeni TaxID=2307231 RepID=A0ABW4INH5_9ACTN